MMKNQDRRFSLPGQLNSSVHFMSGSSHGAWNCCRLGAAGRKPSTWASFPIFCTGRNTFETPRGR